LSVPIYFQTIIINLFYRYILFISFFLAHTTIVSAIKTYYLSALAKNPFQTILGTVAAMKRENNRKEKHIS